MFIKVQWKAIHIQTTYTFAKPQQSWKVLIRIML